MTTLTPDTRQELLDELREDGDRFTLEDGRELVLRVEPDQCASIMDEQGDGAWCGWLEWDRPHPYSVYRSRPDGFDGRAEVIRSDRGDRLWWQPPADAMPGTELHASLRSTIGDILDYGYYAYVLELLAPEDQADHYGRRPVLNAASLGGVEPFADKDHVRSIVSDMLEEVMGA